MSEALYEKNAIMAFGGLGYSPNEYIEGCERVLEYLKERGSYGVSQYSGLSDDLNVIELTNTACIADIMCGRLRGYKSEYFVYWLHKPHTEYRKESADAFWEWLTQESVFSEMFSFKEHFNVKHNSTVCVSADLPHNLMAWMLNWMRLPYENEDYIEKWHKMVKLGVNKELAFSMCTRFDVRGDVVVYNNPNRYFRHSAVANVHCSGVLKFLSGTTTPNEVFDIEPYRTREEYWGIQVNLNKFGGELDPVLRKLGTTEVTVPAVKDLMGEVITPEKTVKGTTPEALNQYYKSTYVFSKEK